MTAGNLDKLPFRGSHPSASARLEQGKGCKRIVTGIIEAAHARKGIPIKHTWSSPVRCYSIPVYYRIQPKSASSQLAAGNQPCWTAWVPLSNMELVKNVWASVIRATRVTDRESSLGIRRNC